MACEESMKTINAVDDDEDVDKDVVDDDVGYDNYDERVFSSSLPGMTLNDDERVFSSCLPGMTLNDYDDAEEATSERVFPLSPPGVGTPTNDNEDQTGGRGKKGGGSLWERRMEKEWEKRRHDRSNTECRLLVRPMGGDSPSISMDMAEVKACRDLGLDLPRDWTVEVPGNVSGVDSCSSGNNSPIANWKISSPGDDPKEVKARLKVWAQAVALASASQLSTSPGPRQGMD